MFRPVLTFAAVISAVGAILFPCLASTNDLVAAPAAIAPDTQNSKIRKNAPVAQGVPLFPAASDPAREGFVRVNGRPQSTY
ncbi:MAG: hypothetical protein OXP09_21270 [Gammaproteobacteria bacterium]|nr:hypothetical protein [Gammaproteobacteria bacterium]